MSDKKSFWTTLPGFATGTATIITAVLGVLGVIRANNSGGEREGQSSQAASSTSSPEENGTSTSPRSLEGGPLARLAPATLDFGKQGVGRSSPVIIATLTNIGSADLSIEGAGISGDDASRFEIAEDECSPRAVLDPKQDCEIRVRFSPNTVGDARATLMVEHNGEGSPSEISLTGQGVLLEL